MLKILSVERKNLPNDLIKINIKVEVNNRKHTIYFQYNKKYFDEDKMKIIDFLVPFLYVVAYKEGIDLDLGGYNISGDLLNNLSKVGEFYDKLLLIDQKKINIINYNVIDNFISKENKKTGLFFSGGVDSLYTMYTINAKVDFLITVFGFDIHDKDANLISKVKEKFDDFGKNNGKEIIYIYTNLREFTEKYINRNYIFGACLGGIGLLLDNILDTFYISSWIDKKIYPWGSHPELDKLRSNNNIKCIHYGNNISRIEKIRYLDKNPYSYKVLRVCRENLGNKYNCSKCEKCIRTILEYNIAGNGNKLETLDKDVNENEILKLSLNNSNFSYYNEIREYLSKSNDLKFKRIGDLIEDKISSFSKLDPKKWKKNKNILFIDFNGVISYKNFWHSYQKDNKDIFDGIQKVLFGENIELVKKWMKGELSSEEICQIIAPKLNIQYEYLYNIFVEDCKNLDVSEKIISQLKGLKKKYKIILVTDNMDCFSRWIVPSHQELFQVFDDIFDSSKLGYFKKDNNGKVFFDYIRKYGAQIENSILIDDSENNCNTFLGIGGLSYQVKGEESVIKKIAIIKRNTKTKWLRQF